jgi:AP-3 complex subunit delta
MNQSQYEIGSAVNCLANIATKELARDCISDLVTLMNHTKPYIRKKAILAMYKLYIKFPQGLRLTFDKLKERLDDQESAVISTAVNVICELANKNPKNYLAMAPKFFKLLTTSSNNWMLIKVVKLLGSLVTEEPRLARKLLEPLTTIIKNTGAKSLQYECIFTITEALPFSKREDGSEAKNAPEVISICSQYLRGFIEDSDQNLKYLGLVGLCNLMRSSPRSVVEHRDLVLNCLNDDDITIRTKALELLAGIASKKSLVNLVHHLLDHARRAEGSYRDEIIGKVLWMCRKEKYGLVTDFAWYTSILLDLAVMQGTKHGLEVADQLMEITLRVDEVRPFAVEAMLSMLLNETLILGHARNTVIEVLRAAAWIIGEYSDIVSCIANDKASDSDDDEEIEGAYYIEGVTGEAIRSIWRGQNLHYLVLRALLHVRATNLPAKVQMVFLQSAMKMFIRSCKDCEFGELTDIIGVMRTGLPHFLQNLDLEVQERASTLRYLLSDFGILPLNWEESTQLVKKNDASESESNPSSINLLDFMPVYEATSVRSVDENGARISMEKRNTLSVMIKERFYAVHSKAQRKVPIPEGLNLQEPFNPSALHKLMKLELQDNLNVGSLTFVKERENAPLHEYENDGHQQKNKATTSFSSAFDEIFTPPVERNQKSEDVFMLKKQQSPDLLPLSAALGEFEEIPQKKKKKEKSNSKTTKKKNKVSVDMTEVMPAGALSSDDDRLSDSKKTNDKKKGGKEKEIELGSVDITQPLQANEVLPVMKHREVSTTLNAKEDKNQAVDSKKVKNRKKKATDDKSNDLLNLSWTAQPEAAKVSEEAVESSEKKLKKVAETVSQPTFWHLYHNGKALTINYSVHANSKDGSQVTVLWSVENVIQPVMEATIEMQINPFVKSFHPKTVEIAKNLSPHSQSQGSLTINLNGCIFDNAITTLSSILHLTTEGLIGPDTIHVSIPLKIFAVATFVPYKIDEDEFVKKINKASSKWAQRSISVPTTTKSKILFKRISEFLHAHLVETDGGSKAAMLAIKSPLNNAKVYLLCKVASAVLSVDIKCLGNTDNDSLTTTLAIAAALEQENF